MITDHTPETLREFERQIAADFDAARIRAPVHLAGGNEKELIDIFERVRKEDWVLTQWRSHYHCLLKGVPPERLRADILAGRSISLCYPEYRIVSSAIVGGVLPIAVGLGMSIKRRAEAFVIGEDGTLREERGVGRERVLVFVGDMTADGGMFHECTQYAVGHDLPVHFVIEANGKSVCTDTQEVWGIGSNETKWEWYHYDLLWPHSGAGKRVQF